MMKLSAGVGFVNFYEKISLRNISQHDKEIFTMRGISRSYHHLSLAFVYIARNKNLNEVEKRPWHRQWIRNFEVKLYESVTAKI